MRKIMISLSMKTRKIYISLWSGLPKRNDKMLLGFSATIKCLKESKSKKENINKFTFGIKKQNKDLQWFMLYFQWNNEASLAVLSTGITEFERKVNTKQNIDELSLEIKKKNK